MSTVSNPFAISPTADVDTPQQTMRAAFDLQRQLVLNQQQQTSLLITCLLVGAALIILAVLAIRYGGKFGSSVREASLEAAATTIVLKRRATGRFGHMVSEVKARADRRDHSKSTIEMEPHILRDEQPK